MSNYCATYIRIVGVYKEAQLLYDLLEWAKEKVPNGWIGEIGNLLGVVDISDGNTYYRGTKEYISCRSRIEEIYFDAHTNEVTISSGDDWSPQLSVYSLLQKKFAPNCKLFFTGEEPGCDVYVTNDPEYIGKWLVDVETNEDSDCESLWYVEESVAKEFLQKKLQSDSESIDELTRLAYESDDCISVHQFSEVSVEDLCC